MPVTAKLSRKFYDRFGDDIANELVDWFNMVDETYRAELRELNERNFARFDSRLEQRLAEQSASLRREISEQGVSLRVEISEQGTAIRDEIAKQGERLNDRIGSLEVRSAREMVVQTRWLIGMWAAQMTAFIGTILIVLRSR